MRFHFRKGIAILLMAAMAIGIMLVGVFAITPGAAEDYIPFTNEPEPDETRDNINTNSPSVVIDQFELGGYFIATQLLASVHDGVTYDEVALAVTTIDGEILGVSSSSWRYIINVPENTEAGLRSLGEILINTYPHIFERVSLSGVTVLDEAIATRPILTNPGSDTGSGDTGPSIVVLTEFPAGEVNVPWIDIEYIAIPTPGAAIVEVFYTINDGASSTVFYHRASPDAPRGQLGTARVFARPYAENRFVFTMLDSAGGEASFEVSNRPGFASMGGALFTPPVPPEARHYTFIPSPEDIASVANLPADDIVRLAMGHPRWIATDRITVIANEGVTPAQMREFAGSIGGTIIGHLPNCTRYVIGFPIRPVEEILELAERLHGGYSPLIRYAWETRRSGFDLRHLRDTGTNNIYSPFFNEPLADDIIRPATGGQVLNPFQSRVFSLSYNQYIY